MRLGNYFFSLPKDVQYSCTLELTTACNFHCQYCSNGRERHDYVKLRSYTKGDIKAISDFFDAHGVWHVLIGGGEPTIHPFFYELVASLQKKHYISVYSNLSFSVDTFTENVKASRCIDMRCTLHDPHNEKIFFEKLSRLKQAGYSPSMVSVATPEKFDRLDGIVARAQEIGVPISIFPLAGPYKSNCYPQSYTAEEKRFLIDRAEHLIFPGHLVRLMSGKEGVINVGQMCKAGREHFAIHAETGNIARCSADHTPLGNIYDNTFFPYATTQPCPSATCIDYCFRDDLGDDYNETFFGTEHTLASFINAADTFAIKTMNQLAQKKQYFLDLVHEKISGKKVLVWGAGMAGTFFYEAYKDTFGEDNEIIAFIDSNKEKRGRRIHNKKIFHIEDISNIAFDIILICAPAFENEIYNILLSKNIQAAQVVRLGRDIAGGCTYVF